MTMLAEATLAVEQEREISVSVRANVISVAIFTNDFPSSRYECRRDKEAWTLLSDEGKLVQLFNGLSETYANAHLVGQVVSAVCKEEEAKGRFLR